MPSGVYKRTPENTKNLNKNKIGKPSWNKGKKLHYTVWNKGKKGVMPKVWNKGTKGIMKANKTSIKKGQRLSIDTEFKKGEKHYRWITDREKVSKSRTKETLCGTEYKEWRLSIYERDNFKCRLLNEECTGKIQAHHIFNWVDYPELRFIINNGITLCHVHHPRGRTEEKRMIPILQELLTVSEE